MIGVDCIFHFDDRIQVRRINLDGTWLPVEQGRQWIDEDGRHILVMVPGQEVIEILLAFGTLQWELKPLPSGTAAVC